MGVEHGARVEASNEEAEAGSGGCESRGHGPCKTRDGPMGQQGRRCHGWGQRCSAWCVRCGVGLRVAGTAREWIKEKKKQKKRYYGCFTIL